MPHFDAAMGLRCNAVQNYASLSNSSHTGAAGVSGLSFAESARLTSPADSRNAAAPERKTFPSDSRRGTKRRIIGECLRELLAQDYREFTLLVLDDASTDGTGAIIAEIAADDARVQLLAGQPIEAGWAGKVWACSQLGAEALNLGADWLLFLDADTRAKPSLVGAALQLAQETGAGMVSAFPYQVAGSFWERVALPMIQFLIITFLPVRMVWESPFKQLVAGCGQFELFSASAYRETGGHASIHNSFHDGLQMARQTKAMGLTVRLFDAAPLMTCRMYEGGRAVWNGFTRNAYEGLGSPPVLVIMTVLQGVLFLCPFGFWILDFGFWIAGRAVSPVVLALVTGQIGIIYLIRVLQARRFGHLGSVWLHPLSVVTLIAIQWGSFWKSLRKKPVAWKGRTYGG